MPFVPAGQTTQLIVGASGESDRQILRLTEGLYRAVGLKRVYYSAYVPVMKGKNLPAIARPPLLRENRLYQADWLLRYYHFQRMNSFQKPFRILTRSWIRKPFGRFSTGACFR